MISFFFTCFNYYRPRPKKNKILKNLPLDIFWKFFLGRVIKCDGWRYKGRWFNLLTEMNFNSQGYLMCENNNPTPLFISNILFLQNCWIINIFFRLTEIKGIITSHENLYHCLYKLFLKFSFFFFFLNMKFGVFPFL